MTDDIDIFVEFIGGKYKFEAEVLSSLSIHFPNSSCQRLSREFDLDTN